jgi:transposase
MKNKNRASVEEEKDEADYLNGSKLREGEKAIVKKLVMPPQIPFTIRSIKDKIDLALNKNTKERTIRRFIKEELKFSYKKGSSRPAKI